MLFGPNETIHNRHDKELDATNQHVTANLFLFRNLILIGHDILVPDSHLVEDRQILIRWLNRNPPVRSVI